jgi:hypothetical protein
MTVIPLVNTAEESVVLTDVSIINNYNGNSDGEPSDLMLLLQVIEQLQSPLVVLLTLLLLYVHVQLRNGGAFDIYCGVGNDYLARRTTHGKQEMDNFCVVIGAGCELRVLLTVNQPVNELLSPLNVKKLISKIRWRTAVDNSNNELALVRAGASNNAFGSDGRTADRNGSVISLVASPRIQRLLGDARPPAEALFTVGFVVDRVPVIGTYSASTKQFVRVSFDVRATLHWDPKVLENQGIDMAVVIFSTDIDAQSSSSSSSAAAVACCTFDELPCCDDVLICGCKNMNTVHLNSPSGRAVGVNKDTASLVSHTLRASFLSPGTYTVAVGLKTTTTSAWKLLQPVLSVDCHL